MIDRRSRYNYKVRNREKAKQSHSLFYCDRILLLPLSAPISLSIAHYPLSLNAPRLTRITDDRVTEDRRDRRRFMGDIPGNRAGHESDIGAAGFQGRRGGLDGDRTCNSGPVNPVRARQERVSCRKQGSVAGISARFQNRTRFRRGTKSNASALIHHAALLDGKFRIEYSYGDSGPFCFSHIP